MTDGDQKRKGKTDDALHVDTFSAVPQRLHGLATDIGAAVLNTGVLNTGVPPGGADGASDELVVRFQQTTGAVMAKWDGRWIRWCEEEARRRKVHSKPKIFAWDEEGRQVTHYGEDGLPRDESINSRALRYLRLVARFRVLSIAAHIPPACCGARAI